MKSPAPLTIPLNPEESRAEYLLRCAAAYISAYAPDKPITYDDECDDMLEGDGETLIRDCLAQAEELEQTRKDQQNSIKIEGKIIQAGGDKEAPTLTITTTASQLRQCKNIPFYQFSNITITPVKP